MGDRDDWLAPFAREAFNAEANRRRAEEDRCRAEEELKQRPYVNHMALEQARARIAEAIRRTHSALSSRGGPAPVECGREFMRSWRGWPVAMTPGRWLLTSGEMATGINDRRPQYIYSPYEFARSVTETTYQTKVVNRYHPGGMYGGGGYSYRDVTADRLAHDSHQFTVWADATANEPIRALMSLLARHNLRP